MTDEQREEFLKDIPKDMQWRMAEGNPQSDITSAGEKINPMPILGGATNDISTDNSIKENTEPKEKA